MTADGEFPLARRGGKSEAAFRTISEVADELDVPQHVLRFWESKFPQVKPLKRGGGRRYYRPEDVGLLRRIRDLLYSEGYTIKGVQKLLKEGIGAKEGGNGAAHGTDAAPELALPVAGGEAPEATAVDEGEAGGEDGDEGEGEGEDEAPRFEIAPADDYDEAEDGAATALAPAMRQELEALLDELEQLRGLLQPRQR